MTFIACAVHEDRIEFMTDTGCYTPGLTHLGRTTKHLVLPHMDAVVLTAGDSAFGLVAMYLAYGQDPLRADFDSLLSTMPDRLQGTWSKGEWSKDDKESVSIILAGYSPSADRFVGYTLHTDTEFTPEPIEGLFVSPAPWSYPPSRGELHKMLKTAARRCPDDSELLRRLRGWADRPPVPPPTTLDEWRELGQEARRTRSPADSFHAVLVMGQLIHGVLRRGSSTVTELCRFDDEGDELAALVAHSFHPLSQMSPCVCGSGRPAIDCCMGPFLDEPCPCGHDGKTLRDCCAVRPPSG